MANARIAGFRAPSVIPGFGVALGFTLTYLSLLVLIPLAALIVRSAGLGLGEFWALATDPRTIAALRLSFGAALVAALINAVFGSCWRGCSSATASLAAGSSMRPSTCHSLSRLLSRASHSPPSTRRTAGSGSFSPRSASRSPTRRSAWSSR
jgi:hypothetical protein